MSRADLGGNAVRDARRAQLVEVQHGAFLAGTQPYDVRAQLASLRVSHADGGWWVGGEAALWLYDVLELPAQLLVVVPAASELAIRPPVRVRRVVDDVLDGARVVRTCDVVALEVAVVQWAAKRPLADVVTLVERLLRERLTTVPRLRARLGRGRLGSAVVRRALAEVAGGSLELDVRRLRAALEARGVTGLEVEVRFTSAGGASAYADLLHRPTMTLFEVDAALDHLERQRFRADRRRDRWMLREHAARTVRVDVTEVRGDLDRLADELVWFCRSEQEQAG